MNKTQQLIAFVKAGTHCIRDGRVYRLATQDHAFSGIRAGDWISTGKSVWRADVVLRASMALGI